MLLRVPASALGLVRRQFRSPRFVEGECDLQGGSGAGRAVQPEVAAECFGAVFEAEQAGAVAEVGAAGAVVADAHVQDAVAFGGMDVGGGGAGVFGGIGECFGDGVVGGGLD